MCEDCRQHDFLDPRAILMRAETGRVWTLFLELRAGLARLARGSSQ